MLKEAFSEEAVLPLRMMDEKDFEPRTWEEWSRIGEIDGVFQFLPARAFSMPMGIWRPCKVMEMIEPDDMYKVVWADTHEECELPRLQIMFLGEDPFVFAKRMVRALQSRDTAYQGLMYNLYIDSMPVEGVPMLAPEQLNRVMTLALNTNRVRHKSIDTTGIIDELNFEYSRTMNRIVFDKELVSVHENEMMRGIVAPVNIVNVTRKAGAVDDMPPHDWAQQYCLFNFNSFLTKGELISCIVKTKQENQNIMSKSLFAPHPTKTTKADEFEKMEIQHIQQTAEYLKDTWLTSLKNSLRNGLKDVGKGWFNLNETKREVYDISKLKKFMTMINFMMQDTLRSMTEESMGSYSNFICGAVSYDVKIEDIGKVESKPTGKSPMKWPLFKLELILNPDGTVDIGSNGLPIPFEQFVEMPLALFDKALASVSNIPQLEPMVVDQIFWSSKPILASVHAAEPGAQHLRQKMKVALEASLVPMRDYIGRFTEFQEILNTNPEEFVNSEMGESVSADGLRKKLTLLFEHKANVEDRIPISIQVGAFELSLDSIRTALQARYQNIITMFLQRVQEKTKATCDDLLKRADVCNKTLRNPCDNIEEVTTLKEFIQELPSFVTEMDQEVHKVLQSYELLDEYKFEYNKDDTKRRWNAYGILLKVSQSLDFAHNSIKSDKEKFEQEMIEAQEEFAGEIQSLTSVINGFSKYADLSKVKEISENASGVLQKLKDASTQAQLFNSRETMLERPLTDYNAPPHDLTKIQKAFEPYSTFWLAANDWVSNKGVWLDGKFNTLDPQQVEDVSQACNRAAIKAVKFFQEKVPELGEVANVIKQEIESFKEYSPLVQALRQPGMRARHWQQLTDVLGFELKPDDNFTLRKGLDEFHLQEKLEQIVKICDIAGKEFSIETALDKMEGEWKGFDLVVKAYRDTGTYVLGGWDETFQLLDDHIVMTQAMTFSPFKGPFEERLDNWEHGLKLCSDILEQWLACQRNWMYLEPIFASDDIQKQLPTESKRFQTVDRNWRKFTAEAFKTPAPLQLCNSERMLNTFTECNKLLDMVSKGLSDYLETKRGGFARFYFLSDQELLEILSQTRDPLAVQPHLGKAFEAIDRLDWSGEGAGMCWTAMNSAEKENVPFDTPVPVKGNVEFWLSAVEGMMKRSIKTTAKNSSDDYKANPGGRKQWVQDWQGQLVLAGSQYYWSIEMEEAMNTGGNAGLRKYYEKMLAQLQELVEIVRSNPPYLITVTLGALMTIDVHARDVTLKMCDDGLEDPKDFAWISQLRYYWEDREDLAGLGSPGFIVRQIQASFPYGMEYLGNTPRLVITPLTDRCYITLTGAMDLLLGGAPQGPAGTGKTETTKDLAKALAKQCVVFNCSDSLDYKAMAKFFKGLASAGAWACFDEFNRINVEVLSVIAQQIISIQTAVRAALTRFVFEGSDIALDPSNAVFITMNPGYAGRAELPDNLKALFRPVAMMVPDYALIAEISLFSFGFGDPRPSSKKMVGTFTLSSEQLSSQDHYDFGMRAVKSVINAAGLLKRADPYGNEETLVMRALLDVNRPKFLKDDLILFQGIISDLFPGTAEPARSYGKLMEAIENRSRHNNLQPVEAFTGKNIQLYETTTVRHGLMLVGPAGGGKTEVIKILAEALTECNGIESFITTNRYIMNPKSITMGQLYGSFDENTHEWTDGILSTIVRQCTYEDNENKKWVVCDGPVDAIWIENMNTVLDDNKKLCLVSGEIIKLSPTICMQFEVEDLAVASPATVSRCGMIFVEPSALGVKVLCTSWLERLPDPFKHLADKFEKLFDAFVEKSLLFLRRNLVEICPTVDNCLVRGLFKVLDAQIAVYLAPNEGEEEVDKGKPDDIVTGAFIYALIWSIGATCDHNGRPKFDQNLRELATEGGFGQIIPGQGNEDESCYDLQFYLNTRKWCGWFDTRQKFVLDARTPFSEVAVPTLDTVRMAHVIKILTLGMNNILCVGQTGTGKSVVVNEQLGKEMPEQFLPKFMAFSASTSANMTQDQIDAVMDKRRKGIFGPPLGKKMLMIVDDLNMPAKEEYGAQPPIEVIRQWMDYEGWYDRKTFEFRNLVDISFTGVMGPPGGGRTALTNRLMRQFNILGFPEMGLPSLKMIFSTIVDAWINFYFQNSPDFGLFQGLSPMLVTATNNVFKAVLKEMLPTPAKAHYAFNLRDLAKVFQGCLSADVKSLTATSDVVRLWIHECNRVFSDRFINDEDRAWFDNLIIAQTKSEFDMEYRDLVQGRLLFGDFGVPGADPRLYQHFKDVDKLVKTMEEYLDDYNAENASKKMNLSLFLDAIEHVSRICRIIRAPMGNALLLGVGGSGRQSLTRLAAFIADYKCFQIEISKGYGKTEWRDDLKKCLKTAGIDNQPIVFLFTDTQIVKEFFMEDINGILNSGDVPNIYANDELEQISGVMRPILASMGLPQTKAVIHSYYLKRVMSNLHVVLAFSPIGDAFRTRLRMYPAMVSCCSLDWFAEWPDEALMNVATQKLNDIEFETPDIRQGVYDMCTNIHLGAAAASRKYVAEMGRHNHVTPTSYLELLNTFRSLYSVKRQEVMKAKHRLEVGLDKLISTAETVAVMQVELTELQPVLQVKSKEVDELMVVISKDKADAEVTEAACAEEESKANEKAKVTKAIADDAQRDLDEALPALDAAVASLKSLKKDDIVEVKALGKPPVGVVMVMEAVCVMFEIKPEKVKDPNDPMKKIDDYMPTVKRQVINDPAKFLDSLFTFDKDAIKDATINKVQKYIDNPDFTPENISKVSKACTSICLWVCAMYKYYHVAKMVEPKKKLLAEAQAELDDTLAKLAVTQKELKEVQERVAKLEADFNSAVAEKQALADKVQMCTVKMERADKLIGGLGGEKIRWQESVEQFKIDYTRVVGDVLAASGCVGYMGAFTMGYREDMYNSWHEGMTKVMVPHSPGCTIISVLEDPVAVRQWRIDGLPADPLSTENGIIISKARRWPLMIDPETQANKWIKNRHAKDGLICVKLSDKDLLRSLENAIRFGKPVLLENILEELDASLEPLLLKQLYKQGGQWMINLGDSAVPWHDDFLFYITTKLRNPYYTPETAVKVTLLNFGITQDGLIQQLLGACVQEERPDLAQMKDQLVVSCAAMNKQMTELESNILKLLAESTGDILDDETLINTLSESKKTSTEVSQKLKEAEITEKDIDETRVKYTPVAFRSTILYFAVADMSVIDPMYQFSLGWFVNLYRRGINEAEASDDFDQRLQNIIEYFTFQVYLNCCRSLFERHKLMFSFLTYARIEAGDGNLDQAEYKFLLAGPTSVQTALPKPADWLPDNSWVELSNLAKLPNFVNLDKTFAEEHLEAFKTMYESASPQDEEMPGEWIKLSYFQIALFIRALRPDKCIQAVQNTVANAMGERFIETPPFDLPGVYNSASATMPIIFILSSGADPTATFLKFADERGFGKKLDAISLGQGQGPLAERMMKEGQDRGSWVLLQNCHLSVSWMPTLERLIEALDPEVVHRDFRLWLTSMPSAAFPVAILQDGAKVVMEPPKGLRTNVLATYLTFEEGYLDDCAKTSEFRKLLFGICFMHAVVQDRRKFGPLGWNVLYEFAAGDLDCCRTQLRYFLNEYEEIPWAVLQFLEAEINYGGRVTDDKDRRLLNTIVRNYTNPDVLDKKYKFSDSGKYWAPDFGTLEEYHEFIRGFPLNPAPEAFGLHDNAEITCAQNESYALFACLLECQPKSASGGGNRDAEILALSADILQRIPAALDLHRAQDLYPTDYNQSLNTVLTQEMTRFNNMLKIVNSTLKTLQKAVKGTVAMSAELDAIGTALFNNQVPKGWAKKAYPSLKPLASWLIDLEARLAFMNKWMDEGHQPCYWISGFFFPQAFLTGAKQNFARKHQYEINKVTFEFLWRDDVNKDTATMPEDGVLMYGMFMEACRWDFEEHKLCDPIPKELFCDAPMLHLNPVYNRETPDFNTLYYCPLYKTLDRAGVLSTTGHSTNFVLMLEMPTDLPQAFWIKRAAALFCALKF
jgi:dynein heavy chain